MRASVTDAVSILLGSLTIALLAPGRLPIVVHSRASHRTNAWRASGRGISTERRRGTATVLLYLAEGALGLPFFAAGAHGIDLLKLSAATGGYLWGFALAAFIIGTLSERGWDRSIRSSIGAMLWPIVIYAIGVPCSRMRWAHHHRRPLRLASTRSCWATWPSYSSPPALCRQLGTFGPRR